MKTIHLHTNQTELNPLKTIKLAKSKQLINRINSIDNTSNIHSDNDKNWKKIGSTLNGMVIETNAYNASRFELVSTPTKSNFFANALLGIFSLLESGIFSLGKNINEKSLNQNLLSNIKANRFIELYRDAELDIKQWVALYSELEKNVLIPTKHKRNQLQSNQNSSDAKLAKAVTIKIDSEHLKNIIQVFQQDKIKNNIILGDSILLLEDDVCEEVYQSEQLIQNKSVRNSIEELNLKIKLFDKDQMPHILNRIKEIRVQLFSRSRLSSLEKWNQLTDLERKLICLESSLNNLYHDKRASEIKFQLLNFDQIYLGYLLDQLQFRFSENAIKRIYLSGLLTLSMVSNDEWLANLKHLNLIKAFHHLSNWQKHSFDLAALAFQCLQFNELLNRSELITSKITNINSLRENFLRQINCESEVQQLIEDYFQINKRLNDDQCRNNATSYNGFVFKNAIGKNFRLFKQDLLNLNRQKFSEATVITQLKIFYEKMGESSFHNIGELNYSLASVIGRFEKYFGQSNITEMSSLKVLIDKIDDYDNQWEAIKKRKHSQASLLMLKPSMMVASHLTETRNILFVDADWKKQLWDNFLKDKFQSILYRSTNEIFLKKLPFSILSLNASDAIDNLSLLQEVKIDFLSEKKQFPDLKISKEVFEDELKNINEGLNLLRKEAFACERIVADLSTHNKLSLAMQYLNNEIKDTKNLFQPLSKTQVSLIALKHYYPHANEHDFLKRNISALVNLFPSSIFKTNQKLSLLDIFEECLDQSDQEKSSTDIMFLNLRNIFNQSINQYLDKNAKKILFLAIKNIREKNLLFGLREIEEEVKEIIASSVQLKKAVKRKPKDVNLFLSLIPFIGSVLTIKDGIQNKEISEVCIGVLSLGLDSAIFLSSPIKLAIESSELIIAAAKKEIFFQPAFERIQFQTIGHVVTQLKPETENIETLISKAILSEERNSKPIVSVAANNEHAQEASLLTENSQSNFQNLNSQQEQHYIYLHNEKRFAYIVKNKIGNSYLEISEDSGEVIKPKRVIYKSSQDNKYFSSRLLGPNYSYLTNEIEDLPKYMRGYQLDEVDQIYQSNGLVSDQILLDFCNEIDACDEISTVTSVIDKDVGNAFQQSIKFRHDNTLAMLALENSVKNYLQKAIKFSPIFKDLISRFLILDDSVIYINLSDKFTYPKAHLTFGKQDKVIEAMAREDLKYEAESQGKSVQQILTSENILKKKIEILNKGNRLTIELPSVEKIKNLSYFSYDGDHPFTLPQVIIHEMIHIVTGIIDINGFNKLGRPLAAEGVGAVDHFTDVILFDMGETIKQRVIYDTEAIMQDVTNPASRAKLCIKAAMQTEAQSRSIDTLLENMNYEVLESSPVLGTRLHSRQTVQEEIRVEAEMVKIINLYKRQAYTKTLDLAVIKRIRKKLINHIYLNMLPDEIAVTFEYAFKHLLTNSQTILEDALYWWHKSSGKVKQWNIYVHHIQSKSSFIEPIQIDHARQTINVIFSEECHYLSKRGVKIIHPSQLAALTLENLFHHGFDAIDHSNLSKLIGITDRGRIVTRANKAVKDIGHHLLDEQISHPLFSLNDAKIKTDLTWMNTQIRRAALKEDNYLKKLFSQSNREIERVLT